MVTNVSKEKREKLIAKVKEIRNFVETAKQDENTSNLLTYVSEIEKDIRGRKYGLLFEEHKESIDETLEKGLPVLTEEKNLFVNNGGLVNFLIEGENLASLELLKRTHRNAIDVIYIDPPYNTGNKDFIYDDLFVDSSDLFKHSKWTSFMSKRLILAKELLSKDGVIFIQIDDNEQANLKMLCDEIFGEDNYLGTIIQNKGNAQNDKKNIQKNHEYILVYAKKRHFVNGKEVPLLFIAEQADKKVLRDEEGRCFIRGSGIVTGGQGGTLNARPNLGYTIYYNEKTREKLAVADYNVELAKTSNDELIIYKDNQDLLNDGYVKIRAPKKHNLLGCWTWSLEKFNHDKNQIEILKTRNGYGIYKKEYISETEAETFEVEKKSPSKSILDFSSGAGTATLVKIFGEKVFNNPKNLDMIKYLIGLHKNKTNTTVLDFFAGSGTTGHAVLELNAEDGGERKFILCTNNENNICKQVTYRRLKAVLETGKCKDSLKYYKVGFVPINDKMYYEYADELLQYIKELVELENWIDFDSNKTIAIKLTDDELNDFLNDSKALAFCKVLYVGHNILPTAEQEKILLDKKIKINIIPNYYYAE